jgi:hypothetical protein
MTDSAMFFEILVQKILKVFIYVGTVSTHKLSNDPFCISTLGNVRNMTSLILRTTLLLWAG